MHMVLGLFFFTMLIYLLVQFARQEEIQDNYEDTIIDIEGRLDWARTRSSLPFGMQTQIEQSGELLGQAKWLWSKHRWQSAYLTALQSQQALDRAQHLYRSMVASRQKSGTRPTFRFSS